MPARHLSSVLLPLPLRPTMPKNSPSATSKVDVVERVELVVAPALERVQGTLLERVVLPVGKAKALADPVDRNGRGGRCVAHPRSLGHRMRGRGGQVAER